MPTNTKPNQKFLKYISQAEGKNRNKRFINLELLINMDKKYPGIFASVMNNFDSVIELREGLDKDGIPVIIPWERALEMFYFGRKYEGVTKETNDIAVVFSEKGVSQEVFDEASELRKIAKKDRVPEHILGKELKEETILESIERIKEQTAYMLEDGIKVLDEIYSKKFTYEWLSKNDPTNSIIGLFVDCCGTITSSYYGRDIARASILEPDVQNLVIRDFEGKIISKGTMYINRKNGYAVINDFELNRKYRENENSSGRYDDAIDSREEQDREMIFQAYLRGIEAFVKEYDEQNPENPLKQINVGTTYNRLKRQIEKYNRATKCLTVPSAYNFRDAEYEQYILYKRDDSNGLEIKNNGEIEYD